MLRTIVKMSGKGDETVAEWDTDTVAPERLAEIDREFQEMTSKGYFAADVTVVDGTPKNEFIGVFDPQSDILMIPAIQGG